MTTEQKTVEPRTGDWVEVWSTTGRGSPGPSAYRDGPTWRMGGRIDKVTSGCNGPSFGVLGADSLRIGYYPASQLTILKRPVRPGDEVTANYRPHIVGDVVPNGWSSEAVTFHRAAHRGGRLNTTNTIEIGPGSLWVHADGTAVDVDQTIQEAKPYGMVTAAPTDVAITPRAGDWVKVRPKHQAHSHEMRWAEKNYCADNIEYTVLKRPVRDGDRLYCYEMHDKHPGYKRLKYYGVGPCLGTDPECTIATFVNTRPGLGGCDNIVNVGPGFALKHEHGDLEVDVKETLREVQKTITERRVIPTRTTAEAIPTAPEDSVTRPMVLPYEHKVGQSWEEQGRKRSVATAVGPTLTVEQLARRFFERDRAVIDAIEKIGDFVLKVPVLIERQGASLGKTVQPVQVNSTIDATKFQAALQRAWDKDEGGRRTYWLREVLHSTLPGLGALR